MYKRVTARQCFMDMAYLISQRSTCGKLNVGAVLVSEQGTILSTGYNGAPRGVSHCTDVGCDEDAASHCTRAVHAEANVVAQAARNGVRTDGSWLFVTHMPCVRCINLLINAGVMGAIYGETYRNDLTRADRAREGKFLMAQYKEEDSEEFVWQPV